MKKTMFIALGTLIAASTIFAQAEPGRRAARTLLTDDDDGQVEVWRRGEAPALQVRNTTLRQPVLEIVFIGSGWQQTTKDAVIGKLRNLSLPPGIAPATIGGSRQLAAPATLNDLQIQGLLDRAMRDGSLPARDENAVHVVFLASNIDSTLGPSRARKDYDSYHSHFHAHDMNVRYVVVPWSDDAATLRDAAASSTLRAVLNPDSE